MSGPSQIRNTIDSKEIGVYPRTTTKQKKDVYKRIGLIIG